MKEEIGPHEGWTGVFTRDQAPGALPGGTRVIKVVSEFGDGHAVGSTGTVLGSLIHPTAGIGYFLEWDAHPRHAVFTVAFKVRQMGKDRACKMATGQ